MSELLTLEGRRSDYSNRFNFVRNSKNVSPKKRRLAKVKPLTCAALSGSLYRYDLEMNGIGSFVKRKAKSLKKTATKKVGSVAKKAQKSAANFVARKLNTAVSKIDKKIVGIAPKPLKPLAKTVTRGPSKLIKSATKAAQLTSRGQYASAIKESALSSLIPKSVTKKTVSIAKKTMIGRNIVKAVAKLDAKASGTINKKAKGVLVKAITSTYGPVAGKAAQVVLPEGATASKVATVVDQIVQSPIAQTPTVANVVQAQEIIESSPETSETKSSSGVGIMAAIAAAAMFML